MVGFLAQGLSAGYPGCPVLTDISFACDCGTLTGVLGSNGSGKTTLLKALCGGIPAEGECRIMGHSPAGLSARRLARLCSYIPQRSGITIDLSVLDVVLMGFNPRLGLLEQPGPPLIAQAKAALCRVGLADRAACSYQTLSEGQKQLCVLARTLAAGSPALLLDEPESALDLPHRHLLLRLVRAWLQEEPDRCALMALHDPNLALNACDRLLLLREGRLIAALDLRTAPPRELEAALSRIYGAVTLTRCRDKTGREHLVILKEDEP